MNDQDRRQNRENVNDRSRWRMPEGASWPITETSVEPLASVCFLTARELGELIFARKVSPVEVVGALLSRIDKYNTMLNAYIYVDAKGALESARAAETEIRGGGYRGPLHGVPVAYKDICDVQGLPTTANSRLMLDYVADRDSTVAYNLRRAGAICMGKLNTNEFASGGKEVFGDDRNPWNTTMSPGGSSSGPAVALASNLVTLAVGSDTGGSIRLPASFNGVVGLKPTYGRVSRAGVVPLSWSLDHMGPMARTVADTAVLLRELAGWDNRDASTAPMGVPDYSAGLEAHLNAIRIGIPRAFFFDAIDPEIATAIRAAIEVIKGLGATLYEVDLPHAPDGLASSWTIAYTEAFSFHWKNFFARSRDYTPAFLHKISSAAFLTAEERITADRMRRIVSSEFLSALRTVDAILTPTNAYPAFRLGGSYPQGDIARLTRPMSLTGLPALSVPCGFTNSGLPVGLQVVGRAWEEATLLRIGHAYEQAAGWHRRRAALTARADSTAARSAASVHQEQDIVVEAAVAAGSEKVDAAWVLKWARMTGLTFVTDTDAGPIAAATAPIKALLSAARDRMEAGVEPALRPVATS